MKGSRKFSNLRKSKVQIEQEIDEEEQTFQQYIGWRMKDKYAIVPCTFFLSTKICRDL